MNKSIQQHVENLGSIDDSVRLNAFQSLLILTESKVDWAYDVWNLMLAKLENENSYQRSIGIMLLCNLAKSDREDRLKTGLHRLLLHTKDEKFITSRQCIQNIWKAATTKSNRDKVVKHLEKRFVECAHEKHFNLLRQDIIQSLVSMSGQDDAILAKARLLISQESDAKNRRKYEALLKQEIHL